MHPKSGQHSQPRLRGWPEVVIDMRVTARLDAPPDTGQENWCDVTSQPWFQNNNEMHPKSGQHSQPRLRGWPKVVVEVAPTRINLRHYFNHRSAGSLMENADLASAETLLAESIAVSQQFC
jgi:hypothetical protein